jgi:YD repeat-containing protein
MSLNRRYIAALILAVLPMATILLMSLSVKDTRAAETVFTYDSLGRLSTVTNSGGAEAVYSFDGNNGGGCPHFIIRAAS